MATWGLYRGSCTKTPGQKEWDHWAVMVHPCHPKKWMRRFKWWQIQRRKQHLSDAPEALDNKLCRIYYNLAKQGY